MEVFDPKQFQSIDPAIVTFVDTTDTLSYVYDLSVGATTAELPRIEHDILETYLEGYQQVRKHKQLKQFVELSGRICTDEVIDYNAPEYKTARDLAVVNDASESTDQFHTMIRLFASNARAFTDLYETRRPTVKKPVLRAQAQPKKPDIDLPDAYSRIDKKILQEIEATEGLSAAAKATLGQIRRKGSFRFEELRKSPAIKALYKHDDGKQLKNDFPALQSEIQTALQASDLSVAWHTTGKARGTTYHLLQVKDVPDLIPEQPVLPAAPVTVPKSEVIIPRLTLEEEQLLARHERRQAGQFTLKLVGFVTEFIDQKQIDRVSARDIAKELEVRLLITRDEARSTVDNLIAADLLFRAGNERGMVLVSVKPVSEVRKNTNGREASKDTESVSPYLSETETKRAHSLMEALIAKRYQNQGLTIRSVLNDMGMEESEARTLMKKMVDFDVLIRQKKWTSGGGSRSRKNRNDMFILIKDQATWARYRENPEEFLQALCEPVETTS